MKLVWEDISVYLYGVISTLATAVVILVRKVLTNEKQLELLKQEITLREQHNKEVRDKIDSSLTEIRTDIKLLMGKDYV